MLELDGEKVPGNSLLVSGNLQIASEDASGETSGTDDVDKGFKAKRFSVSLEIRFSDAQKLNRIVQLAEKKNDKEERHIYTISNKTANIAGVRKVRFSENLSWSELDGNQGWSVSFELKEVLSTSERKEQREKKPPVVAQTSKGAPAGEETNLLKLVTTAEQKDADPVQDVLSSVNEVLDTANSVDVPTSPAGALSDAVDIIQKNANNNDLNGLVDAVRNANALIQKFNL